MQLLRLIGRVACRVIFKACKKNLQPFRGGVSQNKMQTKIRSLTVLQTECNYVTGVGEIKAKTQVTLEMSRASKYLKWNAT